MLNQIAKVRAISTLSFLVLFNFVYCSEVNDSEKPAIDKIVYAWSKAHNNWDMKVFRKLYSPTVLFYCKNLSKEKCISKKSNLLSPKKIFKQKILSIDSYEEYVNGVIKVGFQKEITTDQGIKTYPSYLLLSPYSGSYLIIGESDLVTDKNLGYTLQMKNMTIPLDTAAVTGIPAYRGHSTDSSYGPLPYILVMVLFGVALYLVFRLFPFKNKKASLVSNGNTNESTPTNTQAESEQKTIPIIQEPEQKTEMTSEEKGRAFEEYIVSKFNSNYFYQLEWRSDKFYRGKYAESNKYPDMEYRFTLREFSRTFALECKYLSKPINGRIELKEQQFNNYRNFSKDRRIPVYIVFGIGGSPKAPDKLYLGRLDELKSNVFMLRELNDCDNPSRYSFFYDRNLDRLI